MSVVSFNAKRTERLMHQALGLIEEERFTAAHQIARQLEELRYSGAFEVAARAFLGEGEPEQAVAALERGLALAPEVWSNWQLLGNTLSDLGRFDAAAAAYGRAFACPVHDADSLHFNQAVLASRRGEPEKVLALAAALADPELRLLAVPVAAAGAGQRWAGRRRPKSSAPRASPAARTGPTPTPPPSRRSRRRWPSCGSTRGVEKALVRDLAVKEWHARPASTGLLALLRRIDDQQAPPIRATSGCWWPPSCPPRAKTARSASSPPSTRSPRAPSRRSRMYNALDRREPHAHTRIDQAEAVEPRPDEPQGICWMAAAHLLHGRG